MRGYIGHVSPHYGDEMCISIGTSNIKGFSDPFFDFSMTLMKLNSYSVQWSQSVSLCSTKWMLKLSFVCMDSASVHMGSAQ